MSKDITKNKDIRKCVYNIALLVTTHISIFTDMYLRNDITTDDYNYRIAQVLKWFILYTPYLK